MKANAKEIQAIAHYSRINAIISKKRVALKEKVAAMKKKVVDTFTAAKEKAVEVATKVKETVCSWWSSLVNKIDTKLTEWAC